MLRVFIIADGKQESSCRRGTGCPVDDRPGDDAAVGDPQSLEVRGDTNGADDDTDSKRRQEWGRRRMVVGVGDFSFHDDMNGPRRMRNASFSRFEQAFFYRPFHS